MKKITAVITTFRRPRTLHRAITSVMQQKQTPDELLVIDNANDGETAQIVSSFKGAETTPIRYIVERKRGASAARNRGILEAAYDNVAFLDDDDVWLPNHLYDFTNITRDMGRIALFAGMLGRFSNPSTLIIPETTNLFKDYTDEENSEILLRRRMPLARPFFTPSMSVSIIDTHYARAVLFDEELIGREDIYFVWRLGGAGDIVLHKRVHGLADQLEESLFSVMPNAKGSERLRMDLKKSNYGVLMLEKVLESMPPTPELTDALASAYFDAAYFNAMAGNTKIAFEHLRRSARVKPRIQHLRLAVRVALSPLKRLA